MIVRLRRTTTIALILSPAGVLVLSAARLLIVANSNPATAAAIVSSGGYANTVLGSILPIVAIVIPYLAIVLLFFRLVIPSILLFSAAALISPAALARPRAFALARRYWLHLFGAHGATFPKLIAGFLVVLLVVSLVDAEPLAFLRTVSTVVCVGLIPLVVSIYPLPSKHLSYYEAQLRQPWLAAERITFASHQTVVAYKLGSDGAWIELLMANTATIAYYRESEVTSQQVCDMNPEQKRRPLFALFRSDSVVPPCVQPMPLPHPQRPAPFGANPLGRIVSGIVRTSSLMASTDGSWLAPTAEIVPAPAATPLDELMVPERRNAG